MEVLIPIFVVFGLPVTLVFLSKYFRYKERLLDAERKAEPKQLEQRHKERAELEARIQNLESIVCSVDFELNQRLNRLTVESTHSRSMAVADKEVPARVPAPPAGGTLADPQRVTLGGLSAGQVLVDRYTVERELGHGGMGAVYLARDAKLGEHVALKTILSSLAGDPAEVADRFRREVQAARKVTHPNVIRIHDLGEDGPLLFLSMEYIAGETLYARGQRLGPLPIAEAGEILVATADGVAAAHLSGVVHRDLKPQNVLLGAENGRRIVKVIDFGLAQSSFARGLTATGLIMGTPEYMAPEQIRGGRCDARTDVYALAALAYFLLCGRPPFSGSTPIAVGFAQVHDEAVSPRQIRPEIPERIARAVLKALAKDPADRFLDAGEFRDAIA